MTEFRLYLVTDCGIVKYLSPITRLKDGDFEITYFPNFSSEEVTIKCHSVPISTYKKPRFLIKDVGKKQLPVTLLKGGKMGTEVRIINQPRMYEKEYDYARRCGNWIGYKLSKKPYHVIVSKKNIIPFSENMMHQVMRAYFDEMFMAIRWYGKDFRKGERAKGLVMQWSVQIGDHFYHYFAWQNAFSKEQLSVVTKLTKELMKIGQTVERFQY